MNAHLHPTMAAALRQFGMRPTLDELADDHADAVGEKARARVEAIRAEIAAGSAVQIARVTEALMACFEDSSTLAEFVARIVASGAKDRLIDDVLFDLACAEVEP